MATAMQEGQKLLVRPGMTTDVIRNHLARLKKSLRVRRLDLVVDQHSATSETVHLVGANSPTVEGPPVTRLVPTIQKADGDDVTATGKETQIEIGPDLFTVWVVDGKTVRVRIEQGDEVEPPEPRRASRWRSSGSPAASS